MRVIIGMASRLHLPPKLLDSEWVWGAIALIFDALLGIALGSYTRLSTGEIVIILFVSNIFVLEWKHYHTFSAKSEVSEKERSRIFYKKEDVLREAMAVQSHARNLINTMWTQMPLDNKLKEYFNHSLSEAGGKDIHTTRLIDISRVPLQEILEHIDDAWSFLENLTYRIVFVTDAPFEMLFTDAGEGVFFQTQKSNTVTPVTLAISCSEEEFYAKLFEMFQNVSMNRSREFRASDFPGHDNEKIGDWLKKVKTELQKSDR